MIPVQNIYYLLCYSWNKLEEKDIVNVDATTCNNVVDLFARVLINGCTHLFKKGLDRNYVEVSDSIRGIKGKIHFGHSLKQDLFSRGQAYCDFDELDHNVLHNQILKASIASLIRVKTLDKNLRTELRNIYHKFHGIDLIRVSTHDFSRVALHRNNAFYDFLLKVCKILHDNILITEEEGKYKFKDFVRDEVRMRMVFENFVRNFYRKHLTGARVWPETIRWNAEALEGSSVDLLPVMRTDISIEWKDRKVVIDTKYYAETLSTHFSTEKIRSPHLYQLLAYLKNLEGRGGINLDCEGILLYPTVTQEISTRYKMQGHKISIHTLNLDQHWQGIHADLMGLVTPAVMQNETQ